MKPQKWIWSQDIFYHNKRLIVEFSMGVHLVTSLVPFLTMGATSLIKAYGLHLNGKIFH